MTCTLAIVDPAYSSWSLRGWLLFRRFGLEVTVQTAHLRTPEFAPLLAGFAPARTVPALRIDGGRDPVLVWDSLAIAETLAERYPDIGFGRRTRRPAASPVRWRRRCTRASGRCARPAR